MIDKETFIDTINFLEIVVKKDTKEEEEILFIRRLFALLPFCFRDKVKAKIQIEEYCFYNNFGKPSLDSEYTTPGELYEELI